MGGSDREISVLHVDDEPDLAELAAAHVERGDERLVVETATGHGEALEHLADARVDCIVSDYDMPGMDGIELLEAVRDEDPDLPFILFTGKGSEEIASDAITAGVTDYLQKERGTDQYAVLANRIVNAVEAHRSQRALTEQTRQQETLISNLPGVVYRRRDEPGWPVDNVEGEVETLTGFAAETLESDDRDWIELVHPHDRPSVRDSVRSALAADESFQLTYRIKTNDGATKWVWERGRGVTGDDGEAAIEGFVTDVTERKEREQELRREQEWRRKIFDGSRDAIFISDSDARFVDVNETATELTGYDREELLSMRIPDLHEDSDLDAYRAYHDRIMAGEPATTEAKILRADGTKVPVEFSKRRIEVDGDAYMHTIARDVSDRKEREHKTVRLQRVTADLVRAESVDGVAEAAVRAAEDAFSLSRSGIYLLDDEGTTLEPIAITDDMPDTPRAAAAQSSPHGVTPVLWDAVAADQAIPVGDAGALDRSGTREEPLRSGLVHPLGDHGVFLLASSSEDAIGEADRPLVEVLASIVAAALDRVEQADRLRTERDRFSALFEMVPEPITYVRFEDGEPIILDVNPAFEETFGYEAESVVGESGNEVMVPPDRRADAERLDQRVRSEGTIRQEVRRRTADGVGDFLFRSVPVGDPDRTDEYFGIHVDITGQKAYERKLERQNERLERFASIVSHDLRNPLNVAEGQLELARDAAPNERLDAVARAHERMRTLIDELLALARAGETVTDVAAVDLADVVEHSWATVETGDAKLAVDVDRTVAADEGRLRQLLENLFRNAVEHGGEDVTVRVGTVDDGFYVEDDGGGIPEDEREQVFETGYSSDDGGTGFGLSIVDHVAHAHGWSVDVTESDAGGARMVVRDVRPG